LRNVLTRMLVPESLFYRTNRDLSGANSKGDGHESTSH
jgi:hypothetical protein